MARTNTGRDLQARLLCDTSADSNSASTSADYVQNGFATANTSASTAAGSNVLTFSAEPANFHVGATLSGTGVPSGAYIVARTSTSPYTVTMSKYVTSPTVASGATITAFANTVNDANKNWTASSGAAIADVHGQWAGKTVVAGTRAYYSTGTVTVATSSGTTTITGSGTTFTAAMVGGLLTLTDGASDNTTYLITGYTSATALTAKPITGPTTLGTGAAYAIAYGVRHATVLSNTATTLVVDDWKEPYTNSVVFNSSGTATAGASSTLTDSSKSWSTDQWANYQVRITGGTGVGQARNISSNTATALTVSSNWTTNPDTTSTYVITGPLNNQPFEIITSGSPSFYIGLSTDSTDPVATNVSLTAYNSNDSVDASEISSNGLGRALATYAHTSNTNTVTLSKTFTYSGSTAIGIRKIGVFNASKSGIMSFSTKLPSTATLSASGDTLTITETITIN